jgi:hypothetical protein
LYYTVTRTAVRTLLVQGNLLVARPVRAADGRDAAVVFATFRKVKRATSTCIYTLRMLIPGVSSITSRISSSA